MFNLKYLCLWEKDGKCILFFLNKKISFRSPFFFKTDTRTHKHTRTHISTRCTLFLVSLAHKHTPVTVLDNTNYITPSLPL